MKAISYLRYSLDYSINSRTYQNIFHIIQNSKTQRKRMYSKKTNGEWTIGAKINRSGFAQADRSEITYMSRLNSGNFRFFELRE